MNKPYKIDLIKRDYRKDGTAAIHFKVERNGIEYIASSIRVKHEDWNKNEGVIRNNPKDTKALYEKQFQLERFVEDLHRINGYIPNAKEIKRKYKANTDNKGSYMTIAGAFEKMVIANARKNRKSEGYINDLCNTKSILDRVCRAKYKNSRLPLNYIDSKFWEAFLEFANENNWSYTYRKKIGTHFRLLVDECKEIGVGIAPPTRDFKRGLKKNRKSKSMPLDDLRVLKNYKPKTQKENRYYQAFMFQLESGMSFVDMTSFNSDNIRHYRDGGKAILYNRQKTGESAVVPITSKVDHILKQVNYSFSGIDLSTYLRNLKRICDLLGINKVTSHTARHTFVSLRMMEGYTEKQIQSMTGHYSSASLDIYSKSNEDTVMEAYYEMANKFK